MKTHTITNSSQIRRMMYLEEEQTLRVVFTTGKTYEYYKVPESIYDQAIAAESAGKFFNQNIKNSFEYKAI